MTHHGLGPAQPDLQQLESAPIEPGWVLDGQPVARARELVRSPDGTCTTAHWDCTAGTFRWFFRFEETVHILEGGVRVRNAAGEEVELRAGDTAVMPANEWMVWHVERYVRKLAICRYPVPKPLGRVVRAIQSLQVRLRLGRGRDASSAQPAKA